MSGRLALCLPGGGASAAMFQIGALTALEDFFDGFACDRFDCYIGSSSGAVVSAALAAGKSVARIYRAFLDPADDYLPLERRHVLRMDLAEWRRMAGSALLAFGHGSRSMLWRAVERDPSDLWEELARLYDSVPAGLFSLEGFERFLDEHFARRSIPNQFGEMPRTLRIIAHDLDRGTPAIFGAGELAGVPISRACIASMATPPLFSPVRIGESHYFNTAPVQVSHIDIAVEHGADVIVVVNAMVPIRVNRVPTGHGERSSLRDKGAMWVANQANRIKLHTQLISSIERVKQLSNPPKIVLIEPEPSDGDLFLHNPASFGARRGVLEYAYRYTLDSVRRAVNAGEFPCAEAQWRPKVASA